MNSKCLLKSVLMAGCALALAAPATAETLQGALFKAYRTNPTLTGARADQRALDENVALARVDGLPSAGATVSYGEQIARQPLYGSNPSRFITPPRSVAGQASIDVPLYNGGSVRNAINAAEARVEAGQNDLRGTEASIFSRVVGAYMDVFRDSQVVLLNRQNVNALEVNLRASRDRFEVGDLTRTDVAQSESRLALARSSLELSQAQLITSKENYIALIGEAPDTLEAPPVLPGLPATPDLAVSVALADNPDIRAAQRSIDAARYDVRSAEGSILPRLSLFGSGSYTDYLGSQDSLVTAPYAKNAQAGAQITIPLYQGGRPGAAQRQAVARQSASIEREIEVERSIISQVRAAYASWQASNLAIESNKTAVTAAELSLEGVKAENSVGTRTILDILNAEQEVLNARVQLVTAERNAYVAAFTLIAAMGHAQATDLGMDASMIYDPNVYYHRTRGRLFDFDFAAAPAPAASTTRDIPAQTNAPVPGSGF